MQGMKVGQSLGKKGEEPWTTRGLESPAEVGALPPEAL